MIVCVIQYENKQKEWHPATKPLTFLALCVYVYLLMELVVEGCLGVSVTVELVSSVYATVP